MSTQTSKREQFVKQFDTEDGVDLTIDGFSPSNENVQVSNDQTLFWADTCVEKFGVMEFVNFEENSSWSKGTTEWDDETHTVYVFDGGQTTVIDGKKLEAVASILNKPVEKVADSVLVYRRYPVLIPVDESYIGIAPVAKDPAKIET